MIIPHDHQSAVPAVGLPASPPRIDEHDRLTPEGMILMLDRARMLKGFALNSLDGEVGRINEF
jgi:hypothetical protein